MHFEYAIYYSSDSNADKVFDKDGRVQQEPLADAKSSKLEDKGTMKNPLTQDDIQI